MGVIPSLFNVCFLCFQCKHLLAVRLAPALGVAVEEEVDDDKLVQRISACDYG